MGWWITFGSLFLLALLPLGIWICYDAQGPVVKAVLGGLKLTVYPRPEKKKKQKKEIEEAKKPAAEQPDETLVEKPLPQPPQPPPEEKKPKEKKQGGSLTDFLPLAKMAFDFLGDLRRKLRVKELYLHLILAASDPCDLAVNYGKTWTAVGSFLPVLERWLVIKKRDVEVECDFTASETKVVARAEITITLGRLLSLVAVYAVRGIKEFFIFRNKRKGGAVK